MNDKNEEAFLKSIFGTSPIKKNNKIKKPIPKIEKIKKTKSQQKIISTSVGVLEEKKQNSKSIYRPEKQNINKRLKQGKIQIDKKIDFHGLSLLEAETLFLHTIKDCYNKKLRCLLFVTGKGVLKKNLYNNEEIRLYYGKIRHGFKEWTTKIENQKYILSVENAPIEYGADGAFLVYLRKLKSHSV